LWADCDTPESVNALRAFRPLPSIVAQTRPGRLQAWWPLTAADPAALGEASESATMDQLGHTGPAFTLRVYRHGMRRDAASKQALRELVGLADEGSVVPAEFVAVASR
jgi:hypothetical protein